MERENEKICGGEKVSKSDRSIWFENDMKAKVCGEKCVKRYLAIHNKRVYQRVHDSGTVDEKK